MPIPPRIVDEITKKRYRKEILDIEEVAVRKSTDYKLICPKCGLEMFTFTDRITGRPAGVMCPQCQKQVIPGMSYAADQKLEAKKKRVMNTIDNAVSKQELMGRRDTVSITDDDPREQVYRRGESAGKTLGRTYAGKKKEEDSDEKMLRMHGLTILESKETNPV